jgi:hypothetical protein
METQTNITKTINDLYTGLNETVYERLENGQ